MYLNKDAKIMTRKQRASKPEIEALFFNPETGNEINNIALVIPRRPKVKDWLMMFHKGTELLAKDKEIGLEAHRVFWYVVSHLDYENKLLLSQSDIVRELEMKQPAVSRAFKLLVKKGILIEDGKYGNSKIYKLSTDFGWKGSVRRLKERAKNELEQQKDENPSQTDRAAHKPNLEESVA